MSNERTLDISWGTILKIGVAAALFYFVFILKDILIWFIFGVIISVLFEPAIVFLQGKRMPRSLAVLAVYLSLFLVLGYSVYQVVPIFVSEIQEFIQFFPQYIESANHSLKPLGIEIFKNAENVDLALTKVLNGASANIFSAFSVVFGGIFSTIFIFSIAIFLSLEERGMERAIRMLSPKRHEDYIFGLWKRCRQKVTGWFGARIVVCVFVGLATYASLILLNVEYAASLAFFAGATNIVTILGPIFAGAAITALVALQSWTKALFVLAAFSLIQQLDGSVLTPILTKKFIGLPPVVVVMCVIIGAQLWGVLGAVLAIPLAGILFEFSRDFLKKRKEEEAAEML